ncbi:predicted protein [Histoplasma mississippiense (nom. inval.)]|uniref:predicted protein n=1 Tax=Ajellomyces capsulatus (strain NAm1 / WU24) TaxID=2059318 RepID=UPI000157BD31|nr:predicted protein [Histoplasma mississippiense (nom. inval.)]EDN06039.1 predicted protein [Histoplasma mississippiense (nom. inval.)]
MEPLDIAQRTSRDLMASIDPHTTSEISSRAAGMKMSTPPWKGVLQSTKSEPAQRISDPIANHRDA